MPSEVISAIGEAVNPAHSGRTGKCECYFVAVVSLVSGALKSKPWLCLKNCTGLSYTTRRIRLSECPRRRISKMKSGTAVGFDGPQSPAEFTSNLSGPYISTMSQARCGVHLLTGYNVMPAQKPSSKTWRIVCSSTWSTSTRLRSIRLSSHSMSRIMRVPWYLSARCGV